MPLLVIGGHTRNIGKTGVMSGIIAAFAEREWTAIKITQFGHGVCSANGEPCDCETADHTMAISEERSSDSGKDTARFLAAGAARSFWVRTRQGQLHEAMPRVRQLIASADNVIVESNSILRFVRPTLSVFVIDTREPDFKASALRYLDRIDAFVALGDAAAALDETEAWTHVSASLFRNKPVFIADAGSFRSSALETFLADRLAAA